MYVWDVCAFVFQDYADGDRVVRRVSRRDWRVHVSTDGVCASDRGIVPRFGKNKENAEGVNDGEIGRWEYRILSLFFAAVKKFILLEKFRSHAFLPSVFKSNFFVKSVAEPSVAKSMGFFIGPNRSRIWSTNT
jgi:hypothetical protein